MYEKESKLSQMLQDPLLQKWFNNRARSSPCAADVNIRRVWKFCELTNLTPKQIVSMPIKELQDTMEHLVAKMENDGFAPGTIQALMVGVRSFCENNDVKLERKIKVANLGESLIAQTEHTPTPEEVNQAIAAAMHLRTKLLITMIAYGGFRLEVFGNFKGTDGLVLGDFPELKFSTDPHFTHVPARVNVRAPISKNRKQYFTFINQKACDILIAYLKERIAKGEVLTRESCLIANSNNWSKKGKKFRLTSDISTRIHRALETAGFQMRPYVFRSFFDTNLLIAENRGLISRDFRVFFMGHSGDMERKYTLGKHTLPETMLKEMREGYERASNVLTGQEIDERERQIQMLKNQAAMLGLPEGYVAGMIEKIREQPKRPVDEVVKEYVHSIRLAQVRDGREVGEISLHVPEKDFGRTPDRIADVQRQQAPGIQLVVKSHGMVGPEDPAPASNGPKRLRIKDVQLDEYLTKGYKPIFNLQNGDVVVELT